METDLSFSTPMMQQYLQLKQQYADCILWFRLGDFYEMFLDHAEIGSRILGITLTSRARGKDGRIPMAGVPYHAADSYLGKLVKAGYKVAICEQVSQPNGKTLVDRQVVRVVTPGTILDEKNLDHKDNNYLVSLEYQHSAVGVALVDLSTGDLKIGEIPSLASELTNTLAELISQFHPQEYLLSPNLMSRASFVQALSQSSVTYSTPADWDSWVKNRPLKNKLTLPFQLAIKSPAWPAATALLGYLEHTQKTSLRHLKSPEPLLPSAYLVMDHSTMANLELFQSLNQQPQSGTLLSILDRTVTAMGGRMLRQWLLKPLVEKSQIQQRHTWVSFLKTESSLRSQLHEELRHVSDIERLLSRLSVGLGTPRDLAQLRSTLQRILALNHIVTSTGLRDLRSPKKYLQKADQLLDYLETQITDHPPIDARIGGIIKPGIDQKLDNLKSVRDNSHQLIATLEAQEKQRTGIGSLKIKYNQVFGYYIEVSKANLSAVPQDYLRKQTLVNAERFITPELKDQEEIVLAAEQKINQIEFELFQSAVRHVLDHTTILQRLAMDVAQLDCLLSLALVALANNYQPPTMINSGEIKLIQSRHPVVELLIEEQSFVPNDVYLNQATDQVILLTGPNMAGKSVLMRQVALIVLMAHMGSHVPAEIAEISLTDRIFVRSGAADMITAGLSTFMVEMVETAQILQNATDRSLIVMDEIGRGTSTYDGISLAWAIAEYLVHHPRQGPKTLFATHYHELQTLAESHPQRIKNFHMAITEHEHRPVFLYTLTPGGASHSYGVAVAELAGLPDSVTKRAYQLLNEMEQHTESFSQLSNQVKSKSDLKKAHHSEKDKPTKSSLQLIKELQQISIDELTPLTALNILATWKKTYRHDKD